ncbi:C-reactive protein [Acinonyx jubatus]|uniref:Pentraxin family member n=1 Tax=Acinonyx jubatus TaxID=32536 RepID=A0A6J0A6Y4_ACIJB|nr:C-reactive protein [Acinonyx jubatus]
MDKLSLCFLVVIGLPGAFLQSDMQKKAFVFPIESDKSFVTLFAQVQKPLKAFTVCLRVYTALTRPYSLFSYATRAQSNEILLFKYRSGVYSVSVGGSDAYFKTPEKSYAPVHFCISWESSSGIVELWVDGRPMVRTSLKKGYTVGAGASIILGQEQDSFAGNFDTNQSLVGDIGEVNMWDFVLSPVEINSVYNGKAFSANVLNWQELKYEAQGEVFVKNQLWI